jgi:lysophospholipase L1-like esterase
MKHHSMKYLQLLSFVLILSAQTRAQSTAQTAAETSPQSPALSPFRSGEKVIFIGNSITEAGYYESYIWLYYMLHFPDRRITVINGGIGGERAKNIAERLDDDVVARKPTTVCLTFGMNDTGYYEFGWANADSAAKTRVDESEHYFNLIRKKLNTLPAKKIMITSSPYDETVKNPKNYFPKKSIAMDSVSAFQKRAAAADHWGFVDFFHPMTAITLKWQQKDSAFTLTGSDRIHPGNAGHFVMAWLFLQQQGLAGKPVADIVLDAQPTADATHRTVIKSENCTLSESAITAREVKFNYLAKSLPFPADTVPRLWGNPSAQSEALKIIPFTEQMNKEGLTVKGLAPGEYVVTIDDKAIGQWSADDLANGINLATLPNTPEYDQAMSVLCLNEERMAVESKLRAYYWLQFDYLRGIGRAFNDDAVTMDSVNRQSAKDWAVASKRDNYRAARYPAVRKAWEKEMELLTDEIYHVNQPRRHTIWIKPAPAGPDPQIVK